MKIAILILVMAISGVGQSGGNFVITQAVIAGGGDRSSAGNFEVDVTIGQPEAGQALGSGPFAVTSGFWNYTSLAPTAAGVMISGRVMAVDGTGISNAQMFLQTQDGQIVVSRSGSFGYYLFENVEVGQAVFITVEHKLYSFAPQSVMVLDSVSDLDFVAKP